MILSICDEFQFQGKLSYIRYINIIIELILQNSNKILIVYIKRSLTIACTIKMWNIYTMYSEEPMNYAQCDLAHFWYLILLLFLPIKLLVVHKLTISMY